MHLQLIRQWEREHTTIGVLRPDDCSLRLGERMWSLCTLEDAWLDNRRDVSCIPEGEYVVEPFFSARHGHVWEITGVPERTAILIHSGNTNEDTLGCVLVGTTIGRLGGRPAVLGSRKAMEVLRGKLQGEDVVTLKVMGVRVRETLRGRIIRLGEEDTGG